MTPRPTYNQLVKLVEFLEENPGIASGSLRTAAAKAETKEKWMMVAPAINNVGDAMKDGLGWAKYWCEKKYALKKLCERHASKGELFNVSELDKRMVEAIGGLKAVLRDDSVDDSWLDFPLSPLPPDRNPPVLDSNPQSSLSSCVMPPPPSPLNEVGETPRERSPIGLRSLMRSPQTLPLKKQVLRSIPRATSTTEAVFVPSEPSIPSLDTRDRSPVRSPQTSVSKKPGLQVIKPSTLIKREGIILTHDSYIELSASLDKIGSTQQKINTALTFLAKAYLDLSKKSIKTKKHKF